MIGLLHRAGGALALLALVSSCASEGARSDEFSDHVTIDSAHGYEASLFGPKYEWELQSTVGKDAPHAVGHRLLVWIYPPHPPKALTEGNPVETVRYRFAADDTGTRLPVVPIADARCGFGDNGCAYTRQLVGVPVAGAALRAHVLTGYRVKVSPPDGEPVVLSLAPAVLRQQLTTVDNLVQEQARTPRLAPGAPHLGLAVIDASDAPYADPPRGVIVVATEPSSPAAIAGIEPGDVLQAIGAAPVRATGDLARILASLAAGSSVSLALERDGKPFTASVRL